MFEYFSRLMFRVLLICVLPWLAKTEIAAQISTPNPDKTGLHFSARNVDEAAADRLEMPARIGVEVTRVVADSLAAEVGLKERDVIFLLAERPIQNVKEIHRRLANIKTGEQVTLTVFRDGDEIELSYVNDQPNATANLETMTILAEANDQFYQYSLGRYFEGRDNEQALQWHRRAADSGYQPSMTLLGSYFYRGHAGEPDFAEALKWYERGLTGTDADDPESVYYVGLILLHGKAGNPDIERGLKMMTQSAGLNYHWAWAELGNIYRLGINNVVDRDEEKAFRCFQRAEKLNNPLAPFFIGECYETGRGVTRNYPKAFEYYQKVPTWPAAITRLGTFYQFGFAVEKDLEKARNHYEKASKLGDGLAANNLGGMYDIGLGVEEDRQKAIEYYTLGARKGISKSHQNLGRIYSDEKGGFADLAKARTHFQAAAKAGLTSAMVSLGFMHMNGKGGEKNHAAALGWFQMAAERGDPAGASALGMLYENGWAVPRDRAEAIAWYLKAAEGKDKWATTRLKELQAKD